VSVSLISRVFVGGLWDRRELHASEIRPERYRGPVPACLRHDYEPPPVVRYVESLKVKPRVRLTPEQRREVVDRWLEGNRKFAAGERPETMADIGSSYGITMQAVNWILRRELGDCERRPGRKRYGKCAEDGCDRKAQVRGRCRRHEELRLWKTDPAWKARRLAEQRAYRRRKASERNSR
jgi:hypothetical protein